jgi:hypothetical protein
MLHRSLYAVCFGEATVTLLFLLDFSDRQVYHLFRENTQNEKSRNYENFTLKVIALTLNLPTTTIDAQPFNVIKWQLNFNPVA